jgi:hypothetical protein
MTFRRAALTLALLCASVSTLAAQPFSRPQVRPRRATSPPAIDGVLTDEAWRQAPIATGPWESYNPLHGERVPQLTTVWVSYDSDNLYFAFQCDDPDPSLIKTSITRRDNIWQDDWIGLSLDALGTGQQSYHLLVNPSGVQLDMLNSVAGNEDTAPDWIWDSAGRLTDTGYAVEIRLPLRSIRFRDGVGARMGILFWRRVSRLGVSVSWPALAPGAWVFERHASLLFDGLQPRLPREVLPSATHSRTAIRESPLRWAETDGRSDVGFSAKIGLSPTTTLDATINPDFSQVESDAFQVEVNQRFPIFFGEKRPFFMEGAGIFALAGAGGDGSLRTAVHTRRIVDPVFGAKLTGNVGRIAFGTLSAVDDVPRAAPLGGPDARGHRRFNVARLQYGLGPGSYVGALAADTSFDGSSNRVVGADLSWRVGTTQRVQAFALATRSRASSEEAPTSGAGGQITYGFESRRWVAVGSVEHYDPRFAMATAFVNRVDITSGWAFVDRSFYPDTARFRWIRRLSVLTFLQGGRDGEAGGNDFFEAVGVRFNFTRQGFMRVERSFGFQHWRGERFERDGYRGFGNVQLYRWLQAGGHFFAGQAVFFDPADPFQGRSRNFGLNVTLQPSGRLSQEVGHERIAFDRALTGTRVFTVNIVNTKTTYQFTRALAVRGIVQYDSSRRQVLTDLLSSFEPRPGTVVFAGYGSLVERRGFDGGQWVPGQGDFLTTRRGLFFKASYLYRF